MNIVLCIGKESGRKRHPPPKSLVSLPMRVHTPEEAEEEVVVEPVAEVAVVQLARNATTVERLGTWLERVGHPEVVLRGKAHTMEIAPVQEGM